MTTNCHPKRDFGYSRTVAYDSRSHLSVILQCYGSIWRQVLPYCLFNVALTTFLLYLLSEGIDLTVSEWGHQFMSVLVSFLVVTKFNLTLSVYYEMQKNLMILANATRQVVMMACSLTDNDNTQQQQKWRSQVAYYALLLASTTATMLTKANDWNAWEAPGMSDTELEQLHLIMEPPGMGVGQSFDNVYARLRQQNQHSPSSLNLRVPTRVAHRLQTCISSSTVLDSIQKKQVMNHVEMFLSGYHGICVYLTIPLPFSMVQMARTFLLLYVFSMPFAILSADLNLSDMEVLILVFIMTYGFMGMELVCMHLDDPFGADATDLPVIRQANEVFEDVYLMIMQVDGYDAAAQLRDRMRVRRTMDNPSEKDALISET